MLHVKHESVKYYINFHIFIDDNENSASLWSYCKSLYVCTQLGLSVASSTDILGYIL